MAAIETEIFSALSGVSGMSALVGSNPSRIYPVQAPQNTVMPYIVYTVMNPRDIAVAMGSDGGLYQSRVQVDIYASTFYKSGGCRAIRDLVRTALKRLRNSTIKDSIEVNGGTPINESDPDGCHMVMEYTVWHS